MAYDTRYEPSADFIINGITAHSQQYLKGGSAFGASTVPTLTQVEDMIDQRVFIVMAHLANAGYALAPTDTDVLNILASGVIYGTLMEIELGKVNTVLARGESGRWALYEKRWLEILALIDGPTLEHLGATRTRVPSNGLEFTGRTWTTQDDIAGDTDEKGSMFPRGYLQGDGVRSPAIEIAEPN